MRYIIPCYKEVSSLGGGEKGGCSGGRKRGVFAKGVPGSRSVA